MPRTEADKMIKIQRISVPKIYIEGALYSVTSRGDNEEVIFKDKADYEKYLELLKKYKEQYGFKLYAFCLMPNHLHLLFELKPDLTISDIMHDLNANYTKYFNAKYARKGHLFQERFKMNILEKELYLSDIITYIHLNPISSGLIKDIADYPYSGNKGDGSIFLEKIEPSPLFSKEKMQALGDNLKKNNILGSNEFIERVNAVSQSYKEAAIAKTVTAGPNLKYRRFALAAFIMIILLSISMFYLNSKTSRPEASIKKEYQAKMDSYYREMVKTIQTEKQKAKYLEKKLQSQGSAIRK